MPGDSGAPRRRKSRRYTAPAQQVSDSTLVGVFELPHGAGRPAPGPATGAPADAAGATGATGAAGAKALGESAGKKPNPVLDEQAAEDDPRRWGDSEEDLGDWLKSQRPPHWD
jgi:hypothetical protein